MNNHPVNVDKIEELLATGNIGQFSPQEKVAYINKICDMMGLNPLTRPFEYVNFQGKTVLYARKDCTDQLRKIHGVSIRVTNQAILEGLLTVTVEATDKTGRVDSDVGALSVAGLKGDALANATMKALTKAKRRVTLSICGLGILDETELETIGAHVSAPSLEAISEGAGDKIRELLKANARSEEQLLKYINGKFKTELASIDDFMPAHNEEALRAMNGGSK
jgi:hypothetical protein